jgi:hypothetical protein
LGASTFPADAVITERAVKISAAGQLNIERKKREIGEEPWSSAVVLNLFKVAAHLNQHFKVAAHLNKPFLGCGTLTKKIN